MSAKLTVGLLVIALAPPVCCFADSAPTPASPATAALPTIAAISSAPSPEASPTPHFGGRKRRLLDFNKDGKITIKDALRVAGFHGSFDRIASIGDDGRLAMRSPVKLLGDALLDLADDGKIHPRAPLDYVGLPLMNINGFAKLRYSGRRLLLQRFWKY